MNNSSSRDLSKYTSTGTVSLLCMASHISGDLALIIRTGKRASSGSVQPSGSGEDILHLHQEALSLHNSDQKTHLTP